MSKAGLRCVRVDHTVRHTFTGSQGDIVQYDAVNAVLRYGCSSAVSRIFSSVHINVHLRARRSCSPETRIRKN